MNFRFRYSKCALIKLPTICKNLKFEENLEGPEMQQDKMAEC